ncbi:MAG: hypothetical protein LHW64_03840 [Candidatus Cloacimonetes bacterium]|nr:hypothetical protein [Candidatus Cloacimonadota bacterium]MCB5286917.1 hypothetical protein [Candidatus Cloacimonadota bacterium]MCK9184141.1 hypothetical protein [Candidatus Cloacimonadota bacterium]MDY0229238.1 hypothetical protein [Candidatus Cloacimonadaceae bacterium]
MKKCYISILLLSAVMLSWAVVAIHVSPSSASPGADVELLLEITQGGENLANVDINYRLKGENSWQSEPMQQDAPDSAYWRGIIPSTMIANDILEYRFELKYLSGSTEYIPAKDSMKPNYSLNPLSPQGTQSQGFVLLTDESSMFSDEDYVLAVSFLALISDIDQSSIKVFVNGRDVTKRTEISNSVLMYREEHPKEGIMKAVVTANAKGKQIFSDTWIMQVLAGKGAKRGVPFKLRGSANFSTNIYDVSGNISAAENDYRTWADLYGSYGILDLQTNLLVSSQEDSNMQPINRYTFGLVLPVLDIYLGDYSPNVSKYTLSGKNVRGVYARLHGYYSEFIVSHGESVRKTTYEDGSFKGGTFKQESLAGRFRLGSENCFMIGFNGSRHRDIISSLDEEYYRYETAQGDTVYTAMAQDNVVLSIDARLNVPDQHVMMGVEAAGSLYNSNTIPGPLSIDELADYGLDPEFGGYELDPSNFSDLFVINKNMEPFLPSRANLAWTAYLRMYFLNNFLNLEYSETGSAFNALGTYSQLVDSKMLSITDQMSFGRILTISGGYSISSDNLMGHKNETNDYQNINAQAVLRIPKLPYLKASYYDNVGKNKENTEIEDESFVFSPFNRDSKSMSFGLGYNFLHIPFVPTQFDISYRLGNDYGEMDAGAGLNPISENENSGISFSLSNRYTMIPLRTQISYVSSQNKNILQEKEFANSSIFLKADYSLWSNKIKPYVSYRTTGLKKDYGNQNYTNYNLGVESYPIKNMSVTTDLGMRSYSNDDDSTLDYDTTTFRLCLTQRF